MSSNKTLSRFQLINRIRAPDPVIGILRPCRPGIAAFHTAEVAWSI
jgi:hypothetical protein